MRTVYDYIANQNPMGVKQICEDYGYTITNPRTMRRNLKDLVNNEGEKALKSVMEIHPDKEIILEYFGAKEPKKKNCGCNEKRNEERRLDRIEAYFNASGNQKTTEAQTLATNTNTIIFASALVLAVAIIFKNDK